MDFSAKMLYLLKTIFWGIVCLLLYVCLTPPKHPDAVLRQVFTKRETVMVNQIIDYYDAYVWSQTDPSLPIEKAYQRHFDKGRLYPNTWDNLSPPEDQVTAFLNSLDQEILQCLFQRDSLFYYSQTTDELVKVEPHLYRIQVYSKYIHLLQRLTERNAFYKAYYRQLYDETGSSLSSSTWISCIKDNSTGTDMKAKVNFKKKEERLTCILPFLSFYQYVEAPEGMYIRFDRK